MPFVNNVPFFSIFLAMLAGILMPLVKTGKAALRVTEFTAAVIGALSLWLMIATAQTGESFTFMMGHFPAPWGNEIRSGSLEAMMALAFSIVMILSLEGGKKDMFADLSPQKQSGYCLMVNLMMASLLALVYTNDMFTAYVFVEINAITACALVMARRRGHSLVAAIRYLVLSCVASGLFLMGITILYGITGQLLMPGMDTAVAALAANGNYRLPLFISVALMVLSLAVKSALFPFHGWLPSAYSSATTSASALQSGLVSKGYIILLIKMIVRVFTIETMVDLGITQVLFVLGLLGMIFCSVRALGEQNVKRMLGYSSAAQVAYIFMGIGLGSVVGLVAACYQILAHTFTKPMLFTSAGVLIASGEKRKKWAALRGTGWLNPLAGIAFSVGGLSLCGLPLLAGFAAKYYLAMASMDSPEKMLAVLLVLGGSSVLNAMYYLPGIVAIWYKPAEGALQPVKQERDWGFVISTVVFLIFNVLLGVAIGPTVRLIEVGLAML